MSKPFRLTISFLAAVAVLLGIAVVIAHQRAKIEDASFVPKNERITPEIVQLQQYIRVDTSNPPGNELAGARFLARELAKGGVRAEIIESAPGRANVYARIRGRSQSGGLLLLNHIDVVPADAAQWKFPPFAGDIRLNMLWGRGALDMKSIGLTHLHAFLDVARSGKVPQHDLVFLAVADEEQGSAYGTKWLLENRPQIFEGIRYAITEGGVTETLEEKITYFGVETGSKQFVDFELRAPSRGQLEKARIALEPYFTPEDPDRVLPEVREYFAILAPHRLQPRRLLMDIDRTIAEGKFWLLDPVYRTLTQNTLFVSTIRSNADGFSAMGWLANLPDEDPAARLTVLRELVAPFGVAVMQTKPAAKLAISSIHTPFFEAIERCVHRTYGEVPVGPVIGAASTNDSRWLRPRGIESYGFWPFPVSIYQTWGIHGINERIRLDWYLSGIRMTTSLVRDYMGL